MTTHDSQIIIVGAGVFGLSTALHLVRGGYKSVTVFDKCAYEKTVYNPANEGCDGASCDINKIFRTTYENKTHSQNLAVEARDIWLKWNEQIRKSKQSDLPPPLAPSDELLVRCGVFRLADTAHLHPRYATDLAVTQESQPSFREYMYVKNDAIDEERISKRGLQWHSKFHLFDRVRNGNVSGFLDTEAGFTIADKSCVYAQYLCKKEGVKFVLGAPQGYLETLVIEQSSSQKRVKGIKTRDGLTHCADVVIVACGSWTASVIPEAHRSVEATMGTLMFVDIPPDRQDLRNRFHPNNFPVWRFIQGDSNGGYEGGGFPITSEGRLKFGFRARKFTNFEEHPLNPGLRISTPRTRWSPNPIYTVPSYGLERMKNVIGELFPELTDIGFTDSRLCWYTDSIDNEFVIDYVPGYSDTLFICTGGSGHGFKFLPILGKYVKKQLERTPNVFTPIWKWRTAEKGKAANGIEEGENGPREMSKLKFAQPEDYKWAPSEIAKGTIWENQVGKNS
ncbi:sarcosine oxidase [Colletotrichum truncatum]|uniref:Sarcosine oxidase n=1 Tax=Colletotrichum truncatum TaxID=5467 RepID=A0ACC3ZG82_COLTU|nr:sarcosine oxidase [Colletotrichum truncatum]KAF6802004.1 sarcosine oxidase [Colletotrichum truncatum]